MVNPQLVNWIKAQQAQGYTPEQLYSSLIQQGYAPNDVTEAMSFASQQPTQPKYPPPTQQQQPQQQAQQSFQSPKKPKNMLPVIVISVVFIGMLLAGGGVYLYFSLGLDSNTQQAERLSSGSSQESSKSTTEIELGSEETCDTFECFEENFAECIPSAFTLRLTSTISYYNEILGSKDDLCEIKSRATANPSSEWINKEMVCLYDNSQDYETAAEDISKCEGELYDLMSGKEPSTTEDEDTTSPDTPPLNNESIDITDLNTTLDNESIDATDLNSSESNTTSLENSSDTTE
tara:strand:+ start:555 stop:1427 length:873 start_codon:yes stop_codon:yes gene_type:complete